MTALAQDTGNARVDPRVTGTRAKVIAATLDLVAERGIPATSIEGRLEAVRRREDGDLPELARPAPPRPGGDRVELPPAYGPGHRTLHEDLIALISGLGKALQHAPTAQLMPALIDAVGRDPAFAAPHSGGRPAVTR